MSAPSAEDEQTINEAVVPLISGEDEGEGETSVSDSLRPDTGRVPEVVPNPSKTDDINKLHDFLETMEEGQDEHDNKNEDLNSLLNGLDAGQLNALSESLPFETALHIAARRGLVRATKALIDAGASVRVVDNDGWSPLHWASTNGTTPIVNRLLRDDKSIIDATTAYSNLTPFHLAAYWGSAETTEALLKEGSKADMQDINGCTPLMMATRSESSTTMKMLAEKKSQLEIADDEGYTPLLVAIRNRFSDGVEILLKASANFNVCSNGGESCLHWAMWRFSSNIFNALVVKEDLEIDVKDKEGKTALHYICGASNEELQEHCTLDETVSSSESDDINNTVTSEARYCEILKQLLRSAETEIKTKKGETALHFAVRSRGQLFVEILLKSMDKKQILVSDARGRAPFYLAFARSQKDSAAKPILDLLIQTSQNPAIFNDALLWAAASIERHEIVRLLLSKNCQAEPFPEDFSAIERAALTRVPDVLWCLIATSPYSAQAMHSVNSALKSIKESSTPIGPRTRKEVMDESKRLPIRNQMTRLGYKRPEEDKTQLNDSRFVQDILENPPFAQIYRDSSILETPHLRPEHSSIVEQFESLIVRFYKGKNVFGTIRRRRTVHDAIYDIGPTEIMRDASCQLSRIMENHFVQEKHNMESLGDQGTYDDDKLGFTWIHLPATNIDWMKDLLLRIAVDEEYDTDSFRQVSSFLRDTWFEIPDRSSPSRIMRPRFVERKPPTTTVRKKGEGLSRNAGREEKRKTAHGEEHYDKVQEESGEKTEKREGGRREGKKREAEEEEQEKEDDFIAASAVYIPFLSFSTHFEEGQSDQSSSQNSEAQIAPTAPEHLRKARRKYDELIQAYKDSADSVIHGSATLDESYYHFELEDAESQKERAKRNLYQVVAKLQRKGTIPNTPCSAPWPILRVNQLWIWTIANRWLISATSHPIDDTEQPWLDGFTEHLNKQAEVGGTLSQPGTTTEMMKSIVNYCVGSYERRRIFKESSGQEDRNQKEDKNPKEDQNSSWKSDLSIRQRFSNYINHIGINETDLFDKFKEQRLRETGSSVQTTRINDAISQAEGLFGEIKDIRDELNILKSIAGYQAIVQNKLFGTDSAELDLAATYVVKSIKEMDELAERIQSAVNSTLPLQQSEISNLQSKTAIKQDRVVMMFTAATIFFLPISVLSSLFALDYDSSRNTPFWIFVVIFGTSFLFFIPFVYYIANKHYIISLFQRFGLIETKNESRTSCESAVDPASRKPRNMPRPVIDREGALENERGHEREGSYRSGNHRRRVADEEADMGA